MNSNDHLTHSNKIYNKKSILRKTSSLVSRNVANTIERPAFNSTIISHSSWTLAILSNANLNKSFVDLKWTKRILHFPQAVSKRLHCCHEEIAATGLHVCACPTTDDPQTSQRKYLDLGSGVHFPYHRPTQKKCNTCLLCTHPLALTKKITSSEDSVLVSLLYLCMYRVWSSNSPNFKISKIWHKLEKNS